MEVRLTSFPYNIIQSCTVRYGTARRKPYTLNPTYKFDANVDGTDESHVVFVDDDANDVEDDDNDR